MSPIQQQALDLAAWLFVWTVRIFGTIFAVAFVAGVIGGFVNA